MASVFGRMTQRQALTSSLRMVTATAVILLTGLVASPAQAATSEGAVISNGTVQLGVNAEGDLNYDCAGASDPVCPDPSAGGTSPVGLRHVPTNLESTAPGCLCEGWGVADAGSNLSGFANQAGGDGNITVDSFTAPSGDRAISTVTIADPGLGGYEMQVVQDYQPSPLSPNLYVDRVTITNTGANALTDVRYRRVMDWDVEPTAFSEWVTNQGTSPQLLFSSDDGFASSDPLSGPSYISSEAVCGSGYTGPCQFTDLGSGGTYPTVTTPDDHGGLFDFGLGALSAGESRSFNVYYGAASSETEATDALEAGGAQVYSLGESNCGGATIETCFDPPVAGPAGVEQGEPVTFMFGFVTTVGDLSITKADSPDPVAVDEELTYTITVNNDGPEAAAGVQVTDQLPVGVDFVSATTDQGSCSGTETVVCDLGSIALDGTVEITIVIRPTSVTADLANTATVTSASSDANPANDSATSHTQVTGEGDGTPPDTIIDSPPHGTTADSTPTFDFHSTEANSTFECSIDSGTPSFGPCSGPGASHTPAGPLADGTYTFRVRATDESGNTDPSPAEETFTVQTVAPPVACPGAQQTYTGTKGNDVITGTKLNDLILGLAGHDTLNGANGDDCVNGANGDDTVNGGNGNDLVTGGGGKDIVRGGSGNDKLRAADGSSDVVNCGPGTDTARVDDHDTVKDCETTTG